MTERMPASSRKVGRKRGAVAMRFERLEHPNLTARVYRVLKERILSQQIEVGTRLRDEELAAQLGVSRTPVREALMYLSQEGLVEVYPRSGTRVRTFTEEDIEEIFEVRAALETLAVRKAAGRLDPGEVQRLRTLWEAAERALAKGDAAPALKLDQEMHQLILEASGNRRLKELMARINDYVALFRNLGARTPDHRGYTAELPEILRALELRDVEAAATSLARHIHIAKEQTLKDFRRRSLLRSEGDRPPE
jgi:DNA-binding GntR family transcriptional regulator